METDESDDADWWWQEQGMVAVNLPSLCISQRPYGTATSTARSQVHVGRAEAS